MPTLDDITRKIIGDKIVDYGFLTFDAFVSGFYVSDFARRMAIYQVQSAAITQKVYSAAQTITPEVVKQANDLILQVADKPNYLEAIVGIFFGGLAISVAVHLAYLSQRQYMSQRHK